MLKKLFSMLIISCFLLGQNSNDNSSQANTAIDSVYFIDGTHANLFFVTQNTFRGMVLGGAFGALVSYSNSPSYAPLLDFIGGGALGGLAGFALSSLILLTEENPAFYPEMATRKSQVGFSWIYAPYNVNTNRGFAQFNLKFRTYGKSLLWFNEYHFGLAFGSRESTDKDDYGTYVADYDDKYFLGFRKIFLERWPLNPFVGCEFGKAFIARNDADTRGINGLFVDGLAGFRVNIADILHSDICIRHEFSQVYEELTIYNTYPSGLNTVISISLGGYIF